MGNDSSKPLSSQPSSGDQPFALLDDRRLRERTPALQEGTHIWLTKRHRVPVELIDEADGGIAIVIPEGSFNLGPHIEVEYQGQRRSAIVAYLNKNEDGGYRLGLEWTSFREV